LEDVLIAMRDHADALLPAVRARLDHASTDQAESAAFRRVIQAWQAQPGK
jgi:hypothetical protein